MTTEITSQVEGYPIMRLEMLVGKLSDILSPSRELIAKLRLQSNASVTTRGTLEYIGETNAAIFERLESVLDEVREIKKAMEVTK